MSSDPRQSGTSGGASPGLETTGWHEVQGPVLVRRELRAQWLRQQAVRAAGHLRHWLERGRRAQRRRADLNALLALDDHTLTDIGVRRSEVEGVLSGVLSWEQMASRRDERRSPPADVVRLERNQPSPARRDLDRAA